MTIPPSAETMIGKYQILESAGEGAMGCVYRARDTVLNRFVAIKVMNATIAGDKTLRDRFLREAQSAGSLQHPNVVTVYDFGEVDGHLFIAMEFVDGSDLEELMTSSTPPSLEAKLGIMIDALTGLAYAHQRGIVHRDLKPANIRVATDGHAKLMDFGVAYLESSTMTKTGTMVGTPGYMAPEFISGTPVTTLSDIFSMGAVLHHLLTGVEPFHGDSLHAVLFSVVQKDPPLPSTLVPGLPSALDDIVRRALAKDPADRYQSALDMAIALTRVRAQLRGLPANATQSLSTSLSHRVPSRLVAAARDAASRSVVPGPVDTAGAARDAIASQGVAAPLKRISRTTALVGSVAALMVIGAIGVFLTGDRPTTAPSNADSAAGRLVASSGDVPSTKPPTAAADALPQATPVQTPVPAIGPKTPAASPSSGQPTAGNVRGGASKAPSGSVKPDSSGASGSRVAVTKEPVVGASSAAAANAASGSTAPPTTTPPTTAPPPVSAPPISTPPVSTAAASETPARNVPNELRDLIARYAQAISTRDLAAIRAVYPRLTDEQQRGFEKFFASTTELKATLSLGNIDVNDATAEGRVTGVYAFTSSGRSERTALDFRAVFERRGDKWFLSSVK